MAVYDWTDTAPPELKEIATPFNEHRVKTDISGHLMTLYNITRQMTIQTAVELGVRDGNSTLAILSGMDEGYLYSFDIAECPDAQIRIGNSSKSPQWIFKQVDDIDELATWILPIDFLFIDTTHTLEQTTAELNGWGNYVRKGGKIVLHDIDRRGCMSAIHQYLLENKLRYTFEGHYWCNALGILYKCLPEA